MRGLRSIRGYIGFRVPGRELLQAQARLDILRANGCWVEGVVWCVDVILVMVSTILIA